MNNDFYINFDEAPEKNTHLPEEVYQNLPYPLNECCATIPDIEERNLFVISTLTVLSGMLPNVRAMYMDKAVAPNLYLFVTGAFGNGKGNMLRAKKLADRINSHLYLPVSTSANDTLKQLQRKRGTGILLETEGDTLTKILKKDYGAISSMLRKAFHHEEIRLANNSTIPSPCLSVLLSGTYDQLYKLIPDTEDGLYSRFCYFALSESTEFKNPFNQQSINLMTGLTDAGNYLSPMYQQLFNRRKLLLFFMPNELIAPFNERMSLAKQTTKEWWGEELLGVINRMALIQYRILMILSTLKAYNNKQLDANISTDKELYDVSVHITNMLYHYSLVVYNNIEEKKSTPKKKRNYNTIISTEQGNRIVELYQMGWSLREISTNVFGTKDKYSTVQRYLKRTLSNYK